ncbi:MAG TPA: hypothetical protein VGO31_00175 [Microbacteriaceae bacterium]|jgi:hypothetical protein|nr:hypothetical protein [Microbacteriaceae bacterium]
MAQILQLVGALVILVPFAAQQLGSLRTDSLLYLWPNLFGSSLLAVLALVGRQWGFLLVECCWAVLTARSLIAGGRSTDTGVGV